MSQAIQYDLFENLADFRDEELNLLNLKVENVKSKMDNVQKGLFKRQTELSKTILTHSDLLDKIECRQAALEAFLTEKFGYKPYDGTLNF